MAQVKEFVDGIVEIKDYNYVRSIDDPDAFVNKYIDYFSKLTDSPHAYHEMMAYILLSAATGLLRFDVGGTVTGFRTNLYCLLIGPSSVSRKSTCANFAHRILDGGLTQDFKVAPNFTPGGLQEDLAERPCDSSLLFMDEFQGTWEEMNKQMFMIGTRKMLLSLYDTGNWKYRRTSKGTGKKKEKDVVEITDVSLTVAGLCTEDILENIKVSDITDGFFARFCVCYPFSKSKSSSIFGGGGLRQGDPSKEEKLSAHLYKLYQKCYNIMERIEDGEINDAVQFSEDSIARLEKLEVLFQNRYKENEVMMIISNRMLMTAIKFSVMIAASMSDLSKDDTISVEEKHAIFGINMAKRLIKYSNRVADNLTGSWIEKFRKRVVKVLLSRGGCTSRSDLIRNINVSSKQFNDITLTLIDMHLIYSFIDIIGESKKETQFYALQSYDREKKSLLYDEEEDYE